MISRAIENAFMHNEQRRWCRDKFYFNVLFEDKAGFLAARGLDPGKRSLKKILM